MSHNHNHHCQCDHKDVRFCNVCKVVHCRDCNMEWVTKPTYNYYPYWYNGTVSVGGSSAQDHTYSNQSNSLSAFKDIVLCKHETA